jgi:Uma2 family endonuclease
MREAELRNQHPWTEADYLALGETASRVELIDGGLWVSPAPRIAHQRIGRRLMTVLLPSAEAVELTVDYDINVRLGRDRIVEPDLTVAAVDRLALLADASQVALIVEITSPSNAAVDRTLKRDLYAEAGIGWYLLVEPDHETYKTVTLRLLRLDGKHYVEHAVAKHGETLTSELPFPLEISTEALLDF